MNICFFSTTKPMARAMAAFLRFMILRESSGAWIQLSNFMKTEMRMLYCDAMRGILSLIWKRFFPLPSAGHLFKFSDTTFLSSSRCAAHTLKSESSAACITLIDASFHTPYRFHRLRYKLAPVGAHEVTLGELQQFVMPEQQLSSGAALENTSLLEVAAAPVVSANSGAAVSSTISFKAP